MNGEPEVSGERRPAAKSRLGLEGLDYPIPAAANRIPYMLGGLTAGLIAVLIATGVYLAQFYNPTPLGARDSVLYVITRAPLGDWIRSLHYWAAAGVALSISAHLAYVVWRRSYRRPRELTWWAGVAMAGLIFLLVATGSMLRYDQEGLEALAHLVAGGKLTGALGTFFTDGFTRSAPLLTRVFSLHTSLLPLALVALMGLHFWLIRQLGIHATSTTSVSFRRHAVRLGGLCLLAFAALGVLAALRPTDLGYPPVPGPELTKPFWPLLWVYGLENLLGAPGLVLGPGLLFGYLMALPLLDRGEDDRPGLRSWPGWIALVLALAVVGLWAFGAFGAARQHLGM